MSPERQKIYDSVKKYISTERFNEQCFNGACHVRSFYLGKDLDESVLLDTWACHYDLGSGLTTKSHKDKFIVNNLFHYSISNDTTLKLIDIYKNTMFSAENSSFKDVVNLFTIVVNENHPSRSVFFYHNDLGRDLTPFERAQCFNFFLMSRLFTEHHRRTDNFLDLIENGFSFEEASVFSSWLETKTPLPYYDTHWGLNGPSIRACARWIFRLGPNPKPSKEYSHSGLYVNDSLWSMGEVPILFFDGSGIIKSEPEKGVFGLYNIGRGKLQYEPESKTVTRIQSLRSFLDNYRKEYIKP